MSAAEYVPIACAVHERLEFAVLRRRVLRLRVKDGDGDREETALPLDVFTRDGAEWMTVRTRSGDELTLRLDQLLAIDEG